MRRSLLLSIAVLLPLLAVFVWIRTTRLARASHASAISVVLPEKRQMDSNVLATGAIRLRVGSQVRVGAQISGIVKKLHVGIGTHVHAGEVIAEIDTRAIDAFVAQSQAQVDQDQVAFQKADRDLQRGTELASSGLLPRQQQEDLQWSARAARAKLAKSQADLAAAQVNLSYSNISAPISGTIASVSTQEGETVASSFTSPTFVTLIEDHALELIAVVDEADIANVKPRDSVSFTVEAYPARNLSGTVQRINPTGTILSGVVNYEVVITIGGDTSFLKPDMTANVAIRTAQRQTLLLPNAAVRGDSAEKFVYLEVPGGGPIKRTVAIGNHESGFTEIKSGVSPDDHVLLGPIENDTEQKTNP